MKVVLTENPKIIMSNPDSRHSYFAWPSIARLQNGKLAVVASGFRLKHVCPFGKTVISYSEDEGRTYTLPAPVIDTPLDDRDGGILAFGEKSVMVTSFNNSVRFQREFQKNRTTKDINQAYMLSYLDTVDPEEEQKYWGSTFRISHDLGVTFGEILKSPITSPHGPIQLRDGSILWVGRIFAEKGLDLALDRIFSYRVNPDGSMEKLGEIEDIFYEGKKLLSCEPYAFELADEVLRQGVQSISELILRPGDINLDFADVLTIMKDAGFAHMGMGHAEGKDRAEEAAKAAVESPLLETSIQGAHGVLIYIVAPEDFDFEEMERATSAISEQMHADANIIWGYSLDADMGDAVSVTVIATGLTADYKAAPSRSTTTQVPNQTTFEVSAWPEEDDDLAEITRIFERRNETPNI